MLIAQITDCHVVEPDVLFADRVDSAAGLRAAIDTLDALPTAPDLVLATGDLVNDGRSGQYDHLMELLAPLHCPVVPVVGNHDDRDEIRRYFPDVVPTAEPGEPVDFLVDDHDVRIVVLDTSIPGSNDGDLSAEQLAWLDERLAEQPTRPTIVAQHHPPFGTGVGSMDDDCGFATVERETAVLARHGHVEAVVCGHLHRSIQRRVGGTIAMTCPSTAAALALDLDGRPTRYCDEPTGVVLHHWRPGAGLTCHLVTVGSFARWEPPWA